jgi:uroporphyrin-III C-methyltransferase
MAGQQITALAQHLRQAGWPADTPVLIVSRAGWPDERASDHRLDAMETAATLHAGRPTVVTVGAGAGVVCSRAATTSRDGEGTLGQ